MAVRRPAVIKQHRPLGIAHVREQKEVSQPAARATHLANFAVMMRHKGKEKTTDIPLPSTAIEVLSLEAMSRGLNIAGLIGEVLVAAINKDMIRPATTQGYEIALML
jgi:hypothetical protein